MRASLGCVVVVDVVCVAACSMWRSLCMVLSSVCCLACLLAVCLAFDYDFALLCFALSCLSVRSLYVCVSAFGIFLVLMSFMRAPGRPCVFPALLLLSVHVCCCLKLHTYRDRDTRERSYGIFS